MPKLYQLDVVCENRFAVASGMSRGGADVVSTSPMLAASLPVVVGISGAGREASATDSGGVTVGIGSALNALASEATMVELPIATCGAGADEGVLCVDATFDFVLGMA